MHGQTTGSCQPQMHKRKIFGHSAASFRLLLVWSRPCGPSLTKSGRRWHRAPDCCWNSSTVHAFGRFGGCRLSSPRFSVRLSGSSRHRGPPRGTILPVMRALVVLVVSCLKGSRLWRGTLLQSRRTTFASSEPASGRPSTTQRGCQGRGSWRASGLIHCKRSGARCCSPASPPTSTLLPGSWPWTPSWASAQWSSRLTSGVLPDDLSRMWALSRTVYRSLLSACDGSRLQSWKTAIA